MMESASKPSILILGAGELGNEVISAVWGHPRRNDNSLTVLLRPDPSDDPESNPATLARRDFISTLQRKGISTVRADIVNDTEADLAAVFSSYSTIIGCTGMTYPPGTQLKLAKALLAAKVDRYFPWQYGMDYDAIGRDSSQDLFTEQIDVRDLLRGQSETRWVIVSTGLFMSFLFEPAFGVVGEGMEVVTALGRWDNEITVTVPRDIGRAIAEVLFGDEDVQGVVYIAGETASYERIAGIVETVKKAKIKRELATVEQLDRELKADPDNGMKKYRAVFGEGKGVAWPMEKTFNVRRDMQFCGISQYLAQS
ncbi:MAG: hypothetical protein Q9195_006866 [Heterodermia aff. obscurata]